MFSAAGRFLNDLRKTLPTKFFGKLLFLNAKHAAGGLLNAFLLVPSAEIGSNGVTLQLYATFCVVPI